jgi:hypothetical protein
LMLSNIAAGAGVATCRAASSASRSASTALIDVEMVTFEIKLRRFGCIGKAD